MREMTKFQLGWVVGIIEGEGCVTFGGGHQLVVQVVMCDEDSVRRLYRLTGVGAFAANKNDRPGYSPSFRWRVTVARDAVDLLKLIRPYMSERRQQQIEVAFAGFQKYLEGRKVLRVNSVPMDILST